METEQMPRERANGGLRERCGKKILAVLKGIGLLYLVKTCLIFFGIALAAFGQLIFEVFDPVIGIKDNFEIVGAGFILAVAWPIPHAALDEAYFNWCNPELETTRTSILVSERRSSLKADFLQEEYTKKQSLNFTNLLTSRESISARGEGTRMGLLPFSWVLRDATDQIIFDSMAGELQVFSMTGDTLSDKLIAENVPKHTIAKPATLLKDFEKTAAQARGKPLVILAHNADGKYVIESIDGQASIAISETVAIAAKYDRKIIPFTCDSSKYSSLGLVGVQNTHELALRLGAAARERKSINIVKTLGLSASSEELALAKQLGEKAPWWKLGVKGLGHSLGTVAFFYDAYNHHKQLKEEMKRLEFYGQISTGPWINYLARTNLLTMTNLFSSDAKNEKDREQYLDIFEAEKNKWKATNVAPDVRASITNN